MRTQITIQTLYTFDELSDSAKERAREWWRNLEAQDWDSSCTIDDAKDCAKIIGILIDDVYWSGFYSQGDGATKSGYAWVTSTLDA